MRAAAWCCVLGVACADAPPLTIEALSIEECRAHCVSTVGVELDGVASTHPCGAPIELGPLEGDGPFHLVITATGAYGLRAEADLQPISGPSTPVLRFEPGRRPVIEAATIIGGTKLYGDSELELVGRAFGPAGSRARVTIDGAPGLVAAWNDEQVVVRADHGGSIVVEQCGVSSDPLLFRPPALLAHEIPLVVSGCLEPTLLATESLNASSETVFGVVGCGANCDTSRLVRFSSDTPEVVTVLDSFEGCGIDVAPIDENLIFASTEAGLHVCSGSPLECVLRPDQGRYESLSRSLPDGVATIHRPVGSATTQLRVEVDAGSTFPAGVILPAAFADVRAIDQRYALGVRTATNESLLVEWKDPGVAARAPHILDLCDDPRALRRYRSTDDHERLAIACANGDTSSLHISEVPATANPITKISSALLVGDRPALDLGVDLAAEVLWVWAPDRLSFVSFDGLAPIGHLPLAPGHTGKRLTRASARDRFFLGGPGPGRMTWFALE